MQTDKRTNKKLGDEKEMDSYGMFSTDYRLVISKCTKTVI